MPPPAALILLLLFCEIALFYSWRAFGSQLDLEGLPFFSYCRLYGKKRVSKQGYEQAFEVWSGWNGHPRYSAAAVVL